MKKIFFVLLMTLNSYIIKAQLVIDNSTQTPLELAQNVLLGQGINISNVKFNNSAISANTINDQIEQFSNGTTTNIGIDKGIILSTGNSLIAKGPNDRPLATLPTSNSYIGDNDLYILSNNQVIKSVAILEFDFVPTGNKLNFNFVFASEEYPEFVNDTYNDNFGFFLSGPGITGPFSGNAKNIALIPNTSLPVSINNLNNGVSNSGPCEYCQYYINNESGTTIQYDGFTKVLGATSDVQCGQTYHIKLAIANVGDDNYDSAVFIEGASFSSPGINLGEDLNLCSVNQYELNSGLDSSIIHQWTLDGQIIPNESSPVLIINKSGTYGVKATPLGTGCPASDEIKVGFNMVKIPEISCGVKTSNSIQFDWLPIPNITEYSISYRIGFNPEIQIGSVGNINSYTVSGATPGELVAIIVTAIDTKTNCFNSAARSCLLDTCLDSPTINLNQGSISQQICENTAISDIIFTIGGGATNASITSGSLPAGVTASLIGDQFTIKGIATTEGLFNYTISTSGSCGANASISGSITVIQKTNPTFNSIAPICAGETIAPLPLQSNNGISGTWSPALNNLATTEYTFTPDINQCANPAKLTITVNSKTTPIFNAVAPICAGETIATLPLISNNAISGTWSPALNNLATTEYTFTPDFGQCANPAKLTIAVNSKATPLFNLVAPICAGETIAALPLISNNAFSGTWSPALNNLATTEYTFTPDINQCANSAKLTITVNSKATPLFNQVAPICVGETIAALPLISNNNISGTWSPALNNLATTEYTFTPDFGQCAIPTKLTINVNPKPIPLLTNGQICIDKNTNTIIQSYILDSKLDPRDYYFEWFLNGNVIINAIGNTLETVEKGIYSVIATDKTTNCSSALIEATITETFSDSTVVEIEQTNSFNDAATITISIIQGIGNYEYQLDNGIFQTSPVFSEVAAGSHIINIIDVNGCTNLSKEIVVLGYPKFFTPNGDGNNDTWNIIGFNTQSNPIIYILDRYGKLLKQMSSNGLGWDGTFNGYPLPSSDYWFEVRFLEDGIPKEFKSHFSLKR
ncbi:T9SS type B sorting domain-containing protein [Flavobacterium limnophilum]|uniref:T9SS type B sorting domain-containing protein n=1 Tax=Flavobacterium limnophilum TaxID=3003262 RepID=UPI00248259A3|nr:choice-of-anchor L domain-containing protein [Flavobacterium limnophilum]